MSEIPIANDDLLVWLRGKLADAEKALFARNQMEASWRGGTDKEWNAVGCNLNKAERLRESAMQGRISKKCERDVAMFRAIIQAIEQSTI